MYQASPILIGGRQAAVEEKKSTSSRGKFIYFPMVVMNNDDINVIEKKIIKWKGANIPLNYVI